MNYLYGIWAVLGLALFLWWSARRKAALLLRFAHAEMLVKMMTHVSVKRQRAKAVLLLIGLLLLVGALIEPKWGYHWENVQRRGIDVIVAVDVSRSMLASDIKPSRLERAKRAIVDLLNMMDGDRIGLIAFAGSAFVQCPLTLDYGACKMFVDTLDPQLLPRGGTRIGDAIRMAISSFESEQREKKYRALLLITDGEDHDSDVLAAAQSAKEKGVMIYAIGIGTPAGTPIQLTDEHGRMTYLKDGSGQVVLSKLDEDTLRKAALVTGGAYVPAVGSGMELDEIYTKRIKKMEQRELESSRRKRFEHRFQWPLAAAALCFVIEALVDDRLRAPLPGPPTPRA